MTPWPAKADALDNWKSNSVPSYGVKLRSVTYGNGRYASVGWYSGADPGYIETSADGVTWVPASALTPTNQIWELFDVAFGNGTFVAVGWSFVCGGGNLYHSTNCIDWTPHSSIPRIANFLGVTYGNGLFVAVGDGETCAGPKTNRNIFTSS